MGVEAAALALRAADAPARRAVVRHDRRRPTSTRPTPPPSTPPCASTATSVAADVGGAVRSGGRRAARRARRAPAPTLVVAADIRTGLPGSADEAAGGDGAAALLVGDDADGPVLAEYLGRRQRHRGVPRPLAHAGRRRARSCGRSASARPATCRSASRRGRRRSKAAGLAADEVDHARRHRDPRPGGRARSPSSSARRRRAWSTTWPPPSATPARPSPACCSPPCSRRRRAGPGRSRWCRWPTAPTSLVLPHHRRARRLRAGAPGRRPGRGRRRRRRTASSSPGGACSPSSRPGGPSRPGSSASAAGRNEDWKFGFVGSRDADTGAVHLPPAGSPAADDDMEPVADGRRRRHGRHLHRRPAGLLAEPAGRLRGRRLRRRRPAAGRAHRRRRRRGRDRRPGGDDVPPAVHRRRHPQLLLEGRGRSRSEEE